MITRDIIVIGSSAGGVPVLIELVAGLPAALPAAVLIVTHLSADSRSGLADILSRHGKLLARQPRDGDPIYAGQIYVAPPNRHMVLQAGQVRLNHGPRENRVRPAIDPLFRSAARAYGSRVVGVILSGTLNDGIAGLLAIRAAGGVAVVQDPRDALFASLPQHAQQIAGADHIVPAAHLAATLVELVRQPTPVEGTAMTDPIDRMPDIVNGDMRAQEGGQRAGQVSVLTCPECGGILWQLNEHGLARFRCHVGHAYDGETLLQQQSETLEGALWTAVRSFREKAVLLQQLAVWSRQGGDEAAARQFDEDAGLAEHYGGLIQHHVLRAPGTAEVPKGHELSPPRPNKG
jgi:two-component system chemotaxis response regulator CheB